MNRRLLLVVAFVLIAGGLYGLLIRNTVQQEGAQKQSAGEQFSAWQLRRSLQKGEEVKPAELEPVILTKDEAYKNGIVNKEHFTFIKGSLAAASLEKGSIITENLLVTPDHPDYIDLLIEPGMVPYPIEFNGNNGYPMVLSPGDEVDVVMISSLNQNLARKDVVDKFEGLSVAPLLKARKVLRVGQDGEGMTGQEASTIIVLELTRREVSQLMLAKRVGVLDIHKTTEGLLPQIRAGDVLPDFSSVTELRGIEKIVN